jgi:hypothetical protein
MPSYGVRSRPIYYSVLVQAPAGLTRTEVAQAVTETCHRLGIRPFRPDNAKRVLGSLVNEGLVSVTRLSPSEARGGARVVYRAIADVEGLQEALERPQTTRVVGQWWERKITTGYPPGRDLQTIPSRIYFKVPGYIFESRPRQRVNRLVEDGTWENKAINWIAEDGTPIRKWRWRDQKALETERNRRSKSRASTA